MSTYSNAILLGTLFAVGFGVTSYLGQARAHGWPVGELYSSDTGWIQILGFLSWISAAIMAFIWIRWIPAIAVILCGFAGAFILTNLLKSHFQFLGLLLIPLYIAAWWLMGVF